MIMGIFYLSIKDLTTEMREQAFWRRMEDKYKEKINDIKFSNSSGRF